MFYDMDELAPPATPGEAHAEWHLNTGVRMGPMGGTCPWDACGWLADEIAEQEYLAEQAAAWGEYTEADPEDYADLDAMLADEAADPWLDPDAWDPPF